MPYTKIYDGEIYYSTTNEIYYDPYNMYECVYCLNPTPNESNVCQDCARTYYCYFK